MGTNGLVSVRVRVMVTVITRVRVRVRFMVMVMVRVRVSVRDINRKLVCGYLFFFMLRICYDEGEGRVKFRVRDMVQGPTEQRLDLG